LGRPRWHLRKVRADWMLKASCEWLFTKFINFLASLFS
jgi:hypothetical protein